MSDYYGLSSDFLACHKFSRKSIEEKRLKIFLNKNTKDLEKILSLAGAKDISKELSNGRGDVEGVPAYF